MHYFQRLLFFLFSCALIIGCAKQSAVLLLDNHGGFSHAGRRITLLSDGCYIETAYTDIEKDKHSENGRYTLNPERSLLRLMPEHREVYNLYRIDFDSQQYWVRESERQRITQSNEVLLRQTSLKINP